MRGVTEHLVSPPPLTHSFASPSVRTTLSPRNSTTTSFNLSASNLPLSKGEIDAHTDTDQAFPGHPSLEALLMVRSKLLDGGNVAAPMAYVENPSQATRLAGHKRLPSLAWCVGSSAVTEEDRAQAAAQVEETSARSQDAIDIELRRERNRAHQARYKMKQLNKMASLEDSVQVLKKEIQDLNIQRQVISFRASASHTRWGVTAEYFRLFRNGLKASLEMERPSTSEIVVPVVSQVQRDFLQTAMAPDVVGVIDYGVEALLHNWKLITLCTPDIDIQLVRLEDGPGDSIVAITKGSYTITEDTLRFAFPHLVNGNEVDAWLASRLFGQRLVTTGCTKILWDEEAGRVASIQYTADILMPMLQLLGNLEDVSRVFSSSARLNTESRFVLS
ncbi:hypothetical protein F442_11165 [Phytophthora nicotianae P10297]|uniref:BZIP domain-containing protein n=1 Tax=Phytophthora nicotianae P10297 TaxID=1317064 RepID=W2Z3B7_PHYNI|nr:hypothetical protein F442_11165 [Phytophthora nicotianae P10297]